MWVLAIVYNAGMTLIIRKDLIVPDSLAGNRLDRVAASLLPEYSRARIQAWIKSGALTANGNLMKPRDRLKGGEFLSIEARIEEDNAPASEPISICVVHQDEHLIVINKPAGLVVHPGAGNRKGTLMNALLYHFPDLAHLPRAGIVHRLDKNTSGLMVVARTLEAHTQLTRQIRDKTVGRIYQAVVYGILDRNGKVDAPLGRHSQQRTKIAIREGGRQAITWYERLKTWKKHTHLKLRLETGRTHQIRVHLQHIGYPIVGDTTYGGVFRQPTGASDSRLADVLSGFSRQALHASQLKLVHPVSGENISFQAALPDDMSMLIEALDNEG